MPVPALMSVALRWTPTAAEALVCDREISQFQGLAQKPDLEVIWVIPTATAWSGTSPTETIV